MFETVEAGLVMLGDKVALVPCPLPDRIDDERLISEESGIHVFDEVDEKAKFDGYYYRSLPGLCYYKCGKDKWERIHRREGNQ